MARSSSRIDRDTIDLFYTHGLDIEGKAIDLSNAGNPDMDLDHALAVQVIKGLRILDRIRPEQPITVLIHCEGGDVDAGLAIYDAIRSCKSTVHCEVLGIANSMAAWVLQAGSWRTMHRHSSLMIHDGEGSVGGTEPVIESTRRFQKKQNRLCEEILLERIRQVQPGFTLRRLRKMLSTDTYLTAEEALALGLIDEIVE